MNNYHCLIINCYGPADDSQKEALWNQLYQIRKSHQSPCCIGGDFNEVLKIGERKVSTVLTKGMKCFKSFVIKAELLDLPIEGKTFTWTNMLKDEKWSRLDRFLFCNDWLEKWKCSQWSLQKRLSDHCPILLSDEEKDWGPKLFKVFDVWLDKRNFKDLVQSSWQRCTEDGWGGYVLLKKVQATKKNIKF